LTIAKKDYFCTERGESSILFLYQRIQNQHNMALIEMVMPKMGESIMEGTILRWLKKVGDKIEQDESVLEVATDKVDTEIPALQAGYLHTILVKEGDVVPVGRPIAIISTEALQAQDKTVPAPKGSDNSPKESKALEKDIETLVQTVNKPSQNGSSDNSNPYRLKEAATGRFYSPLVLTIAREEGVSMQELEYILGTGGDNRVTKRDILNYLHHTRNVGKESVVETLAEKTQPVEQIQESPASFINLKKQSREEIPTPIEDPVAKLNKEVQKPQELKQEVKEIPVEVKVEAKQEGPQQTYFPSQPEAPVSSPAVSLDGNVEIIEMDRMRKIIAQRMVDSKRISPHVTSFVEADVTNIVFWRNRIKQQFKEREGEAITLTPIFLEAVAKALRDYPMVNASLEGDKILVKKDIHIGMAVALPNGNLIVPVIHHADQLNIVGLTKKVNDLAKRGRDNKLKMEDLEGGTYTVSNIGSFGNVMGTPIILQPQVGIMSFGAVQKKPAVIETPFGDTLGIRHMMYLSHSYDHRVIDGALGGMFVRRVADYLESFDVNRKIW
jgi:2-oxoglutarate dehydrogenase E2 component (dihydrolipoamide succinyltransferase)